MFSSRKYIIQKGQAFYKILISKNATETEIFAAEELSKFIKESLGVTIQIQTDENVILDENQKLISIGKTKILEYCNFNFDYSSLNEEGFFIKTKGNLIVLDGANERGKLYSVYDFLERLIGIKFLTNEVTHIPKLQEFYVDSLDILEIPCFENRDIFAVEAMSYPLYSARIRVSTIMEGSDTAYLKFGGRYNDVYLGGNGDVHSFHKLLPPSKYKTEHPDWYEGSQGKQICLTNPEVFEEMVNVIIDGIQKNPQVKFVVVGLMDSSSLCMCPNCKKSYEENGGGAQSATLMMFVNKVSRAVNIWLEKNCPKRKITIETIAYDWTFPPPVKIEDGKVVPFCKEVIPDSNVVVQLAGIDIDYFHNLDDPNNKYNKRFYKYMQDWSKLTKNLYVYDYACSFSGYLYYYSNISVLSNYYRLYKQLGVKNVLTQHNGLDDKDFQSLIKTYVISKLMWNPYRDTAKIVKEFCTLYFGDDVAPYVLQTMERFENFYKTMNFYGKGNNLTEPPYLQPRNIPSILLLDCIDILNKADEVVCESGRTENEKKEIIKRIASFKVTPQYMLLIGYDTYFPKDVKGKRKLAEQFFVNTDMCSIKYYFESRDKNIETLKKEYL